MARKKKSTRKKTTNKKPKTSNMAHKKKSHKRKRRSHRMSGIGRIGGLDFSGDLGAILGGAGAGFLNKVIPGSVNPKLSAALKIVVGGVVRRTVKTNIGSGIGSGLQAVGTVELLQQMGILSGIGAPSDTDMMAVSLEGANEEYVGETVLAGNTDVLGAADDLNTINGSGDLNTINGAEDMINGEDDSMGAAYVEEF
jgi:hypothetical protein